MLSVKMRVSVSIAILSLLSSPSVARPEAFPDPEAIPDADPVPDPEAAADPGPVPVPDPDIKTIFDAIQKLQNTTNIHRVVDVTNDESFNDLAVNQKALNILDEINAQAVDDKGLKCVKKMMMRRETEYEEVMTCTHSYDERCHTSYTTSYEPHQEEECDENFRKVCIIYNEQKAMIEMVEECTTPLVPDCNATIDDDCRTVYDTVCSTRREEYEVEEQFPNCQTVNMKKCEPVTLGLKTEEKCVIWPTQQCTVENKTVTHSHPQTDCRKEPRELCAPGDCPLKDVQNMSH